MLVVSSVFLNRSLPSFLGYQLYYYSGLLYNLYADALLSLDFVPSSVYEMQSTFYPTVAAEYGVPLDTRHTYTKTDWEMWAAAIATPSTRKMLHEKIARWINETHTYRAMTDLYDTINGSYPSIQFIARPVLGGSFALLALQLEEQDISYDAISEQILVPGADEITIEKLKWKNTAGERGKSRFRND